MADRLRGAGRFVVGLFVAASVALTLVVITGELLLVTGGLPTTSAGIPDDTWQLALHGAVLFWAEFGAAVTAVLYATAKFGQLLIRQCRRALHSDRQRRVSRDRVVTSG